MGHPNIKDAFLIQINARLYLPNIALNWNHILSGYKFILYNKILLFVKYYLLYLILISPWPLFINFKLHKRQLKNLTNVCFLFNNSTDAFSVLDGVSNFFQISCSTNCPFNSMSMQVVGYMLMNKLMEMSRIMEKCSSMGQNNPMATSRSMVMSMSMGY